MWVGPQMLQASAGTPHIHVGRTCGSKFGYVHGRTECLVAGAPGICGYFPPPQETALPLLAMYDPGTATCLRRISGIQGGSRIAAL